MQKRAHVQVVDPGSSTTDIQSPTLSTTSSSKTPGHKRTLSDEIPSIMDSMLTDTTRYVQRYVQRVRDRMQVLSLDNPLASLFVTDEESHVSSLFRALQSSLPKVNSDAAIKAFMDGIESELGFDPLAEPDRLQAILSNLQPPSSDNSVFLPIVLDQFRPLCHCRHHFLVEAQMS